MLLALLLFVAGAIEYVLAAYWTHAVVSQDVARTAGTTFVNVLLWGFVVTNLRLDDPTLLVIHGIGCALGAAGTCWWTKRAGARSPLRGTLAGAPLPGSGGGA